MQVQQAIKSLPALREGIYHRTSAAADTSRPPSLHLALRATVRFIRHFPPASTLCGIIASCGLTPGPGHCTARVLAPHSVCRRLVDTDVPYPVVCCCRSSPAAFCLLQDCVELLFCLAVPYTHRTVIYSHAYAHAPYMLV